MQVTNAKLILTSIENKQGTSKAGKVFSFWVATLADQKFDKIDYTIADDIVKDVKVFDALKDSVSGEGQTAQVVATVEFVQSGFAIRARLLGIKLVK